MLIAIDLGQQYLKAISDTGERVMIKSVTAEGYARKHLSFAGQTLTGLRNLQVEITHNGHKTLNYVGELAEKFGIFPTYAIGRDGFKSESALILVWTAVTLLVPEEKRKDKIDLALDFPFGQYENLAEGFVKFLRSHRPKVNLGTGDYEIQLGEIKTYPQGWAAAFGVREKYAELQDDDGYNAFVDIGGETTDIVVVENISGDLFLHEELSGTFEHGMKDLRAAVRRSFQHQTGSTLETNAADKAVSRGSLFYNGQDYTFSKELDLAKKQLATAIQEFLSQLWGNKKPWIRTLFWAGGGSETLNEHLKGFHPSERILENAQWANAEGCLLATTIHLNSAKREVAVTSTEVLEQTNLAIQSQTEVPHQPRTTRQEFEPNSEMPTTPHQESQKDPDVNGQTAETESSNNDNAQTLQRQNQGFSNVNQQRSNNGAQQNQAQDKHQNQSHQNQNRGQQTQSPQGQGQGRIHTQPQTQGTGKNRFSESRGAGSDNTGGWGSR
ncbi:hypothetical protein [Alicyclobacillus fodiniaquatilis]|uniref:Actin-like protein N-terminal domain-containing protein n=1 Tax=Alicyclobacillus fodiniaquatilis TaxID=1661150 RepID=A0ABW4JKR3_9BACL